MGVDDLRSRDGQDPGLEGTACGIVAESGHQAYHGGEGLLSGVFGVAGFEAGSTAEGMDDPAVGIDEFLPAAGIRVVLQAADEAGAGL